jgi:HlyD family secretion protein
MRPLGIGGSSTLRRPTTVIAVGGATLSVVALLVLRIPQAILPSAASTAEPSVPVEAAARSFVAALGRIEPRSRIVNVSASANGRLDDLSVEPGHSVAKGQVLGHLAGYPEQIAARDQIRAQLDEARAQLSAEAALGVANVKQAEAALRQTIDLTPLRITAQEEYVAGLRAELENNRSVLSSQRTLHQRQFTPRLTYENQNTVVLGNEAAARMGQARLDELKRQFVLDQAERLAQIEQVRAQAVRAQAAIPVASLERQLAVAEARVASMTVAAPIAGRVLNVLLRPGDSVNGNTILKIGDISRMHAVAEVYETDIRYVRLGQSATARSTALPRPLRGEVVEIGQMIFKNDILNVDPAARADARVVEVRVELEPDKLVEQLTNLSVDVKIDLAAVAGSLAAPVGAR